LWGRVGEPPLVVSQFLVTIAMSGYIFGIPYAVFAALLLLAIWSRSLSAYKYAALLAPILFDFLVIGCTTVFVLINGGQAAQAFGSKFLPFYVLAIGLGYAYVGFVFAGAWFLAKVDVLRDAGAISQHSA